jgi:hypothetical protein
MDHHPCTKWLLITENLYAILSSPIAKRLGAKNLVIPESCEAKISDTDTAKVSLLTSSVQNIEQCFRIHGFKMFD